MYRLRERGEAGAEWPCPPDMPEAVWRLLRRRGIASAEEAELFLHPAAVPLHAPESFPGVPEAVRRLREAIAAGREICVWGDYDVDGVCAAAILSSALERLGARVRVHIPLRAEEGYGLNADGVRRVAGEGAQLLVTVDCGISDKENAALARELGMEIIITDHHRADAAHLPECLIVSAQMGAYPCPALCGAGVAYKLVCALDARFEEEYIDLAALATVADIVPLTGENRTIVARGLARMNEGARPGILALLQEAGAQGRLVTEDTLGYQIGPRLNAAGRLGSAERALRLLRARDMAEAVPLASELNLENASRRAMERNVAAQAHEILRKWDFTARRAIVLRGRGWNAGVIGIAASRLVEEYHFPVLLFAEQDGELKGSCRSIPGVDIFLALRSCERFFVRWGGHAAAAGITMRSEDFEPFCEALDAYLRENIPPETYVPECEYDTAVSLDEMTVAACEAIEGLRPFGVGNPAPLLLARCRAVGARRIGADGSHLKLWLTDGDDRHVDAVWFGHGAQADELGGELIALGELKKNAFQDRVSAQMICRMLLPESGAARLGGEDSVSPSFLTELVYTEPIPDEPPAVAIDAIAARTGLQGTVFAAASVRAAAKALEALRAAGLPFEPDVAFGRWTEDERCFTAIAVRPEGEIPVGVRAVVALDLPREAFLPRTRGRDIAVYRLAGFARMPNWLDDLPGLDDLREIFSAARRLSSRPLIAHDRGDLVRELAREACLAPHAAWTGLMALEDMRLLTVRDKPVAVETGPVRKADPRENRLFRHIENLRTRGAMQPD